MKSFYMDREDRVECVREEADDLRRRIFRLKLSCWAGFALWFLGVVVSCILGIAEVLPSWVVLTFPVSALVLIYALMAVRSQWETLSEALAERDEFLKGTKS